MALDALIGSLSGEALRKMGMDFAKGMQQGSAGFSSTNTTGEGRAGGRGNLDEAKQQIRAAQLRHKLEKNIIQNYKDLGDTLKSNKKKLGQVTDDLDVFARVFTNKWNGVLEQVSKSGRAEQNLIKQTNRAMGGNITSLEDVLALRQEQLELEKKIQQADGKQNAEIIANIARYKKVSGALNEATDDIESFGDSLIDTAKSTVRGFFSFKAALTNITVAAVQLTNDFRSQLKHGSHLGIIANQMAAITQGVDPGALTEMLGEARQVSLAFGSVEKYTTQLTVEQRKYYRMIGDTTDALRFVNESYRMLGEAGIKPVAGAMDSLGHTFAFLNTAAGVTSDQFTSIMDGMLQDVDIREQLRAAQEGERASIVAGVAKQLELNVAMGMTIEQATAAAKSLGRLSGESAKDRFKRAAQVQMMMGAMGIEGGGRAAELIRKGQRIDKSTEGVELQGKMTQLANAAVRTKRGGINSEIMVDTLMGKMNLDQYLGKGSDFVTTTASAIAPQKEQLDKMYSEATRQSSALEDMLLSVDLIKNFLVAGALGKLMVGGAQLIGAYIIGKGILGAGGAGVAASMSAAGAGVAAAATGTALVLGAGAVGAGLGYAGYKAIDDTSFGIGLSDLIGRTVDAVGSKWGLIDEAAADERMQTLAAADSNAYQEKSKIQRDEAKALQEAQLLATERQSETMKTIAEFTAKTIDVTEFNARMTRIGAMGQSTGLSNY